MPICADCGQPTANAARCEACEAVEVALTPRSSQVIEPPRQTIAFPVLIPERETRALPRIALWAAVGLAVVALVLGVVYAWRSRTF